MCKTNCNFEKFENTVNLIKHSVRKVGNDGLNCRCYGLHGVDHGEEILESYNVQKNNAI